MDRSGIVTLMFAILAAIISIAAFVLPDAQKHKVLRTVLGISFLLATMVLGGIAGALLILPTSMTFQIVAVPESSPSGNVPMPVHTDAPMSATAPADASVQPAFSATDEPELLEVEIPPAVPATPVSSIEAVPSKPIVPRFRQMSLSNFGKPESGNLGLPTGIMALAGVDFEIGWMVTTRSVGDPSMPETVILNIDEPVPSKIHFLLQGSWATSPDQEFGSVHLSFLGGGSISVPLVVGQNIRDWSQVNVPLTDPTAREAWRGVGWDGHTEGVVDALTIDVPPEFQNTRLTKIEVSDESMSRLGSPNPGIHLWAVTLEE